MSKQSSPSMAAHSPESLDIPTFTITRREDLSLQFHPPVGSLELANALSLKYPMQTSLRKQIQCALIDHIDRERQLRPYAGPPGDGSALPPPPPPNSTASFGEIPDPGHLTGAWNVTTGQPVRIKRRKKPYGDEKRHKVAKVRKSGACEYHRRKKTEVMMSISPPVPSDGLH